MSTTDTDRFDQTVTTTCGCCGVGCRLEAHARQGRIVEPMFGQIKANRSRRVASRQRQHDAPLLRQDAEQPHCRNVLAADRTRTGNGVGDR